MRREGNVHNIVNLLLGEFGVLEYLFDRLHGLAEEIQVEFLEFCSGKSLGKIGTIEESFDLNLDGHLTRQRSFSLLDLSLEFTHRAKILGDILTVVLSFPDFDEMIDDSVIEIFSSEMSVSSGSLDLEDTLLNREERDIESSSSEIENENVLLSDGLLVESVSDGGGGRLVDDSENVHSGDDTGVLGGLSLRIVEVGGDGDNCIATTRQASFGVPRKGED